MRFILKILVAPFALALTVLAYLFTFVLSMSGFIFSIASGLVFVGSAILFIAGETAGGIAFLAVAFLVSPYGIPALAGKLVGALASAGGSLRRFMAL